MTPTQGGETTLLDLATRNWSQEWNERLGIPHELLPPVPNPEPRSANSSPRPPTWLGLRPGRLVAVGAADLDAGALARLREFGEVEYSSFRDAKRLLTGPALASALKGMDVFVTEIDVVDAEIILGCHAVGKHPPELPTDVVRELRKLSDLVA